MSGSMIVLTMSILGFVAVLFLTKLGNDIKKRKHGHTHKSL